MKKILLTIFIISNIFAIDLIKLPLMELNVNHKYSNGKEQVINIKREVDEVCLNVPINVENFQSENLASSKVNSKCKKTFITTQGLIQPITFDEKIKTVGELEVLNFILGKSSKYSSEYILVDSRTKDWFDAGTIPSAVNIPYNDLDYDEDFLDDYKKAYKNLGVKVLGKDKFDFKNAKTAIFFCNGSWCGQSPRAMKKLIKIGYPKEKMMWYRGGIAAWAGVSLTLTKNIGK
ncbi:MAG: rhodanese-like domain-containing protein [Halarcobacter sp.]